MEEEPSTSSGIKRSIPQELQDEIDEIVSKHPRATAAPADLDENQKRWLVVGICLHSVISPAMRNYVVPTLTKLCYKLSIKHKLETQTFTGHLQTHPRTNRTLLNYEAVNNNKVKHGYYKQRYDYKIKSVLDLSKLFLQTHMAHYTGFDDTCDSSALLGLIINIDEFDPVVKSVAEDVRRNIRNPWAHCDFTEWDAIKYSNSFQLMKKLVKDLKLSLNEETQIIGEIEKWELNGPRFLSGTTYGLELVNEFCQQTRALAEYSQLVTTETDSNFIGMQNELKKVEIHVLFYVDQLKKDIEKRFFEIDKVLGDHDTHLEILRDNISKCACHDFHVVEIEFWKKQELMFVETPPVIKVLQCLQSEHTALIVGEPGIGKSMLMHHVALKIHPSYCIVPCLGIQDIFSHYNMDKRQMFVIDDICGRFTSSLSDIEFLIKNEDNLKQILGKRKTKIAATCRLDIYFEETVCKSCSLFQTNIFNLSDEYSKDDKLKICMKYLSKTSCELLKDQNVEFTPLMCYLYSKNEEFNLTDFLHCPYNTYQQEWEKLKVMNPHKYCSLFLCVIHNGIIKESLFDIFNESNNKNKDVLDNIYEICEVNRGTSRIKMKSTVDSMIGTYLVKTKTEYRVIHDKMFDFLCSYFGSKETLVRCILRCADIRVFNERTQLESIKEKYDNFTILIPNTYEQEYFERIKNDLQLGKINQCFCNSQMKHEKYRAKFLKVLQTIDDNFLFEQMFSRKCLQYTSKHKENVYVEPNIDSNEYSSYADDNCDLFEPLITSCSRGYYDIVQFFVTKYVDLKNYYSFYTPLTAACREGQEKIVQLLIDKRCDVTLADGSGYTPMTAACLRENENIVQLLIDKGYDVTQDYGSVLTPMTAACREGNEKIVQLLIEKGCDVTQADGFKMTPLTAACGGGNYKIVQLLIDKGCVVTEADELGTTPLIAACEGGNYKIVQLLIDKGCVVTEADEIEPTPLTAACEAGNYEIVQLLIDKGCDVNRADDWLASPMTAACWKGNYKIVKLLIDKGCDVTLAGGMVQAPMTAACCGGNEKIVQLLIDRGCDVTQADGTKQTPMTAACRRGNEKTVQLLIDKGCDVSEADGSEHTPMTAACEGGNYEIVQLLINKGCDVSQVDGSKHTPMTAACRGRNEKIVQLLIDKGCAVTKAYGTRETPLTAACEGGNCKIVQLLIDKGCDVTQADGTEKTPMTAACRKGNLKIVQLLIDKGYDVTQVDGTKQTPLIAACIGGNERIVQLLIDKGCDVTKADGIGETPLISACEEGNYKIVQLLIDNGCDVTQADGKGETPLIAACEGGNYKIVQLLIDKGCDVTKNDGKGETPLIAACKRGEYKIVQLLIDKGCDVTKADGKGETPLIAACKIGYYKIVQLLIDKGCDVTQATDIGETPLIAACEDGNYKIVQLLINKGCDVNKADGKGETPLKAACEEGNYRIVQLLIDKGCDVTQADG